MTRFDPAARAAELRALADQLHAEANRAHGGDHPLRGLVRYVGGTYRLSHLGVTGTGTTGPADAMRSWARAAHRKAEALERPRLPQTARTPE